MSDIDDLDDFAVGFSNDSSRARLLPREEPTRNDRQEMEELETFAAQENELDRADFERESREEVSLENGEDERDTYDVSEAVEKLGFGKFQITLISVVGFFVIADALEMMLLSILAPTIRCIWHLNSVEEAFITTVVFIGMMLGSSFWGWLADALGRKFTVILSALWIFYFGLLSAFSPHYYWIIALRCLVGFGIGGAPQATTLLSEFLPLKSRALSILSLAVFWAIGSTFTVAVAMVVMPSLGWRWLLGILCIPLLVFLFMSKWLPESCRFFLAAGERDKAIEVLAKMARSNKKELPSGEFVDASQNKPRGRIIDLFMNGQWKTTGLLWLIWFNLAFSYYGIVLTTTEMFQAFGETGTCDIEGSGDKSSCNECRLLTVADYTDMMWTTVAEFPGSDVISAISRTAHVFRLVHDITSIILTMIIIDLIGRKKTAAFNFFGTVVCYVLLMFCNGRTFMTICIFGVRGFISGAFQTFYVYTPEVYPTVNRALGLGCCSAFARIGAMLTPFVAQVLIKQSTKLALGTYAMTSALSLLGSLLLPVETGGRALQDS